MNCRNAFQMEIIRMGRNKRYLYLDCDEARLVLQSLIRFKNKLQQQDRFTDCVDELILKVSEVL